MQNCVVFVRWDSFRPCATPMGATSAASPARAEASGSDCPGRCGHPARSPIRRLLRGPEVGTDEMIGSLDRFRESRRLSEVCSSEEFLRELAIPAQREGRGQAGTTEVATGARAIFPMAPHLRGLSSAKLIPAQPSPAFHSGALCSSNDHRQCLQMSRMWPPTPAACRGKYRSGEAPRTNRDIDLLSP